MTTEAQHEAQLEAVHAPVSVGINGLEAFLASGKSLNPFNVKRYIGAKLSDTLEKIEDLMDGVTMGQFSIALSLLVGDSTLSLALTLCWNRLPSQLKTEEAFMIVRTC